MPEWGVCRGWDAAARLSWMHVCPSVFFRLRFSLTSVFPPQINAAAVAGVLLLVRNRAAPQPHCLTQPCNSAHDRHPLRTARIVPCGLRMFWCCSARLGSEGDALGVRRRRRRRCTGRLQPPLCLGILQDVHDRCACGAAAAATLHFRLRVAGATDGPTHASSSCWHCSKHIHTVTVCARRPINRMVCPRNATASRCFW